MALYLRGVTGHARCSEKLRRQPESTKLERSEVAMLVLRADHHFRTAAADVDQECLLLAEMHTARHAKVNEASLFKP